MLIEALFNYINDCADGLDELPDGAWYMSHVDIVTMYNEEFGTDYDWYDIQVDYFEWKEGQ